MKTVLVIITVNALLCSTYGAVIVAPAASNTTSSNQQSQVDVKFVTTKISVPPADRNCKIKGKQRCQKCYPSFYYNLVSKVCVPVSPLCLTWNDQGECLTCFEGYQLFISICVMETDTEDTQSIKDPNCYSYVNDTCEECSYRFYFNQERICTTVHPDCKTWENKTGACTSCFDGFDLKGAQCISTVSNTTLQLSVSQAFSNSTFVAIPNCASYNGSECAVCAFRYYKANGSCQKVSDLCKSWSEVDGSCTTCYSGYDLQVGRCNLRDPFCTIKVTGVCVQCADRYYLDTKLRCQGVNPRCKSYDPLEGTCTSCYDGYGLDANGSCSVGG